MTEVWIYVVGASRDPDNVRCMVPWQVDERLIFFGPCMKRIREDLREQFLTPGCNHKKVTADLFFVGVNGGNREKIRKIVWAGRLSEVMTFAEADKRFKGDRFQKLRDHPCSPLHVRPILKGGELIGYEHRGKLHEGKWISDLVSPSEMTENPNIKVEEGKKLTLQQGTACQVFDRDCCMLLENRFFASGQGVRFDDEALEILRHAQPKRSGIDSYAVFGRTKGRAIGLRGTCLEITGDPAERFVEWLKDRSRKVAKHQQKHYHGPTKTRCY